MSAASNPCFIFTGEASELTPQLEGVIARLTAATSAVGLKPTPLGTAIEDMIEAKLRAGMSRLYVQGLRQYLTAWAHGKESRMLHEVTTEELEQWFKHRAEKPTVREPNRGRISALFSFGMRKNWCRANPADGVERVRMVHKSPVILGPRKAMRLLLYLLKRHPQNLAFAVLCLKCGLRPFEAVSPHGVSWDNIDLDGGTIVIDAMATKVRKRRVVQLTPDAREWLKLAKQAGSVLPLRIANKHRATRRMRVGLGLRAWPQDVLRHTAASVLLATTGDLVFTSRNLGNSPVMVLRFYAALLRKPEAERYLFKPKPRHWKLAEDIGRMKEAKDAESVRQ